MIGSPGGVTKTLGPLIGAIDQGTNSTRFTVFVAATGELVTYHQLPVKTQSPQPGWLEVNPECTFNSVVDCIDATIANLEKLDIEPNDIVAIGLASQRCTAIAWDKATGDLIYPGCIMAGDLRATHMAEELKKSRYLTCQGVRILSGLPISAYFSAVKFKWIIKNCEDAVKTAILEERLLIGTTDSYLMWRLTGGKDGGLHMTDVTNASLTGLMNLETLMWDEKLCKHFGIPYNILPKIRSCSEVYGALTISRLKGLPISGCIGDQQAAMVGQNCWRPGQAKTTFGNGAFTLYNVGPKIKYSEKGLLSTVAYKLGKDAPVVYALEGAVKDAGSLVDWLTSLGMSYSGSEKQSSTLDINYTNNVILVPSSSGCLSPYWRPNGDGLLLGISTSHPDASNGQNIYQAALETIAFQNRDILEAMQTESEMKLTTILADGGLSQNNLMMQIQADYLGIPVLRPSMTETTSLGAAIIAGMAKGVDAWRAEGTIDLTLDRFMPRLTESQSDIRYEHWKNAQNKSFNWTDSQNTNQFKDPSVPNDSFNLTNHERWLRASVCPAIFFWTSFLLWKVSYSFSGDY